MRSSNFKHSKAEKGESIGEMCHGKRLGDKLP